MRIAMIASGDGPNARYRVFGPAEALRARGHRVFASVFREMKDTNSLLDYDVVLGWRMHDEFFTRVVRLLGDANIGFVWDNDDNFTALEQKGRANYRLFNSLRGHRLLADMEALMRAANIVTTPSAGLAAYYRETVGADVRVLENYVEPASPRFTPSKPQQVVVGWIAHMEHQTDIERLGLQETMQRLLDRHPHVHVVTVGCGLGVDSERYHHIRNVPFEDLRGYVSSFDVGLAPIVDSAFNRSRSNVKVKEYATLGVPWLASPIGPYEGLGQDEGGRLVSDDRWYDEVERLVLDGRARRKLAKRAAKWARSQTFEENAHRWEAAFREAAERAGRRVS
jgi:glycosyltransferase involved in cell wall biosynthesis